MEGINAGEVLSADLGFVDGQPYLTVTDMYSKCSKTWSAGKKSNVPGIIKEHIAWLKTQFNYTLKCIICDGGGEFINQSFVNKEAWK